METTLAWGSDIGVVVEARLDHRPNHERRRYLHRRLVQHRRMLPHVVRVVGPPPFLMPSPPR